MRRACSTAPSMGEASLLMSNRFSFRRSCPATSSSWTISAPTKDSRCEKRSGGPEPSSSSPTALQPRSQSDRTGLCQAQATHACRRRTNHRGNMESRRKPAQTLPTRRMQKLLRQCRIRFNVRFKQLQFTVDPEFSPPLNSLPAPVCPRYSAPLPCRPRQSSRNGWTGHPGRRCSSRYQGPAP